MWRLSRSTLTGIGLVVLAVGTLVVAIVWEPGPSGADEPIGSGKTPATNAWLSEDAIVAAMAFRDTWGLPADRNAVVVLGGDPSAVKNAAEFGVPLTIPELKTLLRRATGVDRVRDAFVRYGKEHPEAWGGMAIADEQIVVLLANDDGRHARELRRLVNPHTPLAIEAARWSLAEVEALRALIPRDPWFQERFDLLDLGIDVERNKVELRVSSADRAVIDAITAHYGADGMLDVTIDGTAVTSLPTGHIRGQVFDRGTGLPVPGLTVELVGDIPGAAGQGDVGKGTSELGRFEYRDVAATGYDVRLYRDCDAEGRHLEGRDRVLLETAHAAVLPDRTTGLRVEVDWPGCPF
jgi:hypothetical protein